MTLLDEVARWVQRAMSGLPPDVRQVVWFPVFAAVVFIGLYLVVRKALPVVVQAVGMLARWVIIGVAAAFLLVEVAAAAACRRSGKKPPDILYSYGDAVGGSANGIVLAGTATKAVFARAARANALVIMLLVAFWLWEWNQAHCPTRVVVTHGKQVTHSTCVRPVSQWIQALNSK